MGGEFLHGMGGADEDMEGEPGEEQPAGPIVAEEQENATKDGEEADGGNEKVVGLECASFQVVDETGDTRKDKQDAENEDGQGTLHNKPRL